MSYDVEAVRRGFPSLAAGTAHFDGPGGSQVLAVVGEAVAATLTASIANRGTVTEAERRGERSSWRRGRRSPTWSAGTRVAWCSAGR